MNVVEYSSREPQVCAAPRTVNAVRPPQKSLQFPGPFCRHLAKGSMLFRGGELRQLYLVETGALCHYTQLAEDRYNIIEFVFPGEIIGLGCLATHVSTAKTMADTYVRAISDADLDRALKYDDRLFFRVAEAREREFEYLRNSALKARSQSPVERVANFLLAIAGANAAEGRDPLIMTDDVTSGYVAEQLQMSVDTLAKALLSLRRNDLVDVSGHLLCILDLAALEAVAADASTRSCEPEVIR